MGSALVSTNRDLPRVTRVASSVSLPGSGRASEKPQATHRRSSDPKSTTIRSSALQLGHTAPAINRGLGVLLSLGDVIDNATNRELAKIRVQRPVDRHAPYQNDTKLQLSE